MQDPLKVIFDIDMIYHEKRLVALPNDIDLSAERTLVYKDRRIGRRYYPYAVKLKLRIGYLYAP